MTNCTKRPIFLLGRVKRLIDVIVWRDVSLEEWFAI